MPRGGTRKKVKEKTGKTRQELRPILYQTLEAHLPSTTLKKEEHGEVFTPLTLVEEMCDAFPADIWTEKDMTWLDPSAGMGHFSVVLFFRLMDGLEKAIPSPTLRARHIIEKMLFMVEIDPQNARTCRSLFRTLCPSATPRLALQDFFDSLPVSWPSTFSCILGNPPYNLGGTKRIGTKRAHLPFTQRSLSILSPKGYLGFICPPSYRETHTPMNRMFQDKDSGHFVYLRILSPKETYQQFRIQGRVDLFLFQANVSGTTRMIDEYGSVEPSIHLRLDRHIPNFGYAIFQKLFDAVEKYGKVEAYRTTECTTVHSEKFGCNGPHRLLHLIIEGGRRVYHSRVKHSLEGVPKILINGLGIPYVEYDKKGRYGPTQSPLVVERPSPSVVQLLQSPLFVFIVWGLRLTGNNNLPYLFDAVPRASLAQLGLTVAQKKWIKDHFQTYTFEDKEIVVACS